MNIVMTGATGYVGSHILQDLVSHGHTVQALTRREANPVINGVTWLSGNLESLSNYKNDLANADTIIHCAMEYQDGKEAGDQDLAALGIMLESGAHLIMTGNLYTSQANSEGVIEETLEEIPENWRSKAEHKVVGAVGGGTSIRLGFVYGGTGGYFWQVFAPDDKGQILYTGDGAATWPMVHIEDVARLYRMAAEQKITGILHAADNKPTAVSKMAEISGIHQNGKPFQVPYQEAKQKLGGFADHMLRTISVSATKAREHGWTPIHPNFEQAAKKAYLDYINHHPKQAAE